MNSQTLMMKMKRGLMRKVVLVPSKKTNQRLMRFPVFHLYFPLCFPLCFPVFPCVSLCFPVFHLCFPILYISCYDPSVFWGNWLNHPHLERWSISAVNIISLQKQSLESAQSMGSFSPGLGPVLITCGGNMHKYTNTQTHTHMKYTNNNFRCTQIQKQSLESAQSMGSFSPGLGPVLITCERRQGSVEWRNMHKYTITQTRNHGFAMYQGLVDTHGNKDVSRDVGMLRHVALSCASFSCVQLCKFCQSAWFVWVWVLLSCVSCF